MASLVKTNPFNKFRKLIEGCLESLGVDPGECCVETDGKTEATWDYKHGSAEVSVRIGVDDDNGAFTVCSPLLSIPPKDGTAIFLRRLLQLNHDLFGCSLELTEKGTLLLMAARSLEGLSAEEALELMRVVGSRADELDDILRKEFEWFFEGSAFPRAVALVEGFMVSEGLKPEELRMEFTPDEKALWVLPSDETVTFVNLHVDGSAGFLQAFCPLVHLPEDKMLLPFYRRLLEENNRLINLAVTVRDDEVHLESSRDLEGLDPSEVADILGRVAHFSAGLREALHKEFEAPLWTS